jgi:predicted protein tyrosine phosphatase
VCGRQQWRSPTAEAIYRKDPRFLIRSAGVSSKSRHQITDEDLAWADLVLVMERKYKSRILGTFRDHPNLPRIVSLDIPDEYERMDPELVSLIQSGTEFHLKQQFDIEPNAAPNGGPATQLGNSGVTETPPSVS